MKAFPPAGPLAAASGGIVKSYTALQLIDIVCLSRSICGALAFCSTNFFAASLLSNRRKVTRHIGALSTLYTRLQVICRLDRKT